MKTFKEYLTESAKELPWNSNPHIGWWEDNKVLRLYHGTNIRNLESVLKNGINKPDPNTGLISMALEPNTAFAYASMSGAGGEADFRKIGANPVHTKNSDRVVFVFDIPMEWIKKYYDPILSGNTPKERAKMQNKKLYRPGADSMYYTLTELRFKTSIPPNFLVGYMTKSSK